MESLNYRIKLILLAFVIVALGILSYKRTVKGTVELVGQFNELKNEKSNQQELLLMTNAVKADLRQVEQYLGNNSTNVQHIILEEVSQFCTKNKIHLSHVEQPVITVENDLKTSTYEITLHGDFRRILKLVHYLEFDFKEAVLVSTDYYTIKNHAKNKKDLYAKLYLQSIDKI